MSDRLIDNGLQQAIQLKSVSKSVGSAPSLSRSEGEGWGGVRWRCRRGMRELDLLLTRYLERDWAQASEAERGVFLQLLDCEDDRLWRWFLGHEIAPDAALDALVCHIRALPP